MVIRNHGKTFNQKEKKTYLTTSGYEKQIKRVKVDLFMNVKF